MNEIILFICILGFGLSCYLLGKIRGKKGKQK